MRTIDITDKLNFSDKPQIKIKDTVISVNNEAVTILEIIPLLENDESITNVYKVCSCLFSEDDFKKIKSLSLSFDDFVTLVKTAITLVTNDTSGEAVTRAMT